MQPYINRREAGLVLAKELTDYANRNDVIILALPRGGVPVAYEVAQALSAPLDVFIVRKLGVPGHEELAMGAIAMGDSVVFNQGIVEDLHIPQSSIDHVIQLEKAELKRRDLLYRNNRPLPNLTDKTIILVDDGIATGASMRAAIFALRHFNPRSIIVAVPVASQDQCSEMAKIADQIICPLIPQNFYAVGQWYQNFSQTSDEEVYELLAQSAAQMGQHSM